MCVFASNLLVLNLLVFPLCVVSGWFLPGSGSLCSPANSHPQFGGALPLPSSHGCERYSTLRSHRASPYPSPYPHRTTSPSKNTHTFLLSFHWHT